MTAKFVLPLGATVTKLEDRLRQVDLPQLPECWYRRAVAVLRGGDGGEHGKLLYLLAVAASTGRSKMTALDVGTARGFSALVFARAIQDAEVAGTVYSIDVVGQTDKKNWHIGKHSQDDPLVNQIVSRQQIWNRWYRGDFAAVDAIKGRSVDILSNWSHGLIDVAFLDGSHAYEDVSRELTLLDGLMAEYGVIVLDDYHLGEVVGRIRSRAVNLLAWLLGRTIGRVADGLGRFAPRLGQATEYRLVKQRFGGVKRALDEFVQQSNSTWKLELISMPRRGPYQGHDYCVAVLSREGITDLCPRREA